MNRQEIIESIEQDICQFDYPVTDVNELENSRAIAARDIFLPMIRKMDNEWLQEHEDIDIMELAVLIDGIPSLKRVRRLYPELLNNK